MSALAAVYKNQAKEKKRASLKVVSNKRYKKRRLMFKRSEWQKVRLEKFARNVKMGGAAKAYRIALQVRQFEVGEYFGVSYSAVCHWESGCYMGWTAQDLADYCKVCDGLAPKG